MLSAQRDRVYPERPDLEGDNAAVLCEGTTHKSSEPGGWDNESHQGVRESFEDKKTSSRAKLQP